MRYVQLIYNPVAGQKIFKTRLDYMVEVFQNAGYELRIHRTSSNEDFTSFFEKKSFEHCEAIIVAGGDGSFNRTVNALKANKLDIPLGLIPAGTANDFARHIGIPDNIQEAINVVAKLKYKKLDIGLANDRHFINVCSGGLLTNISHDIDTELKNTLGKLAYYIKGVQQLPKFRSLKFRIKTKEKTYEEDLFLFLVLNGSSAGGFNRIGEYASMTDGKLDFVGIKACPINDMAVVFRKLLLGEHLEDKNILFFQSESMVIECLEEEDLPSDIDGEKGPSYPIEISVLPQNISVIVS